jgi:hypothetical protein
MLALNQRSKQKGTKMKKTNNEQIAFGEAIPGAISFGQPSEVVNQNWLLGLMVAAIAVATVMLVRITPPSSQESTTSRVGDPVILVGATAEDVMPQRTESIYYFQSTDSTQEVGSSDAFQITSSDAIQGSAGTAPVR